MASHLYGDLPDSKNRDVDDAVTTTEWTNVAKPPPETRPVAEVVKGEVASRGGSLAPPASVLKKQSRVATSGVTDVHAGHREAESAKCEYRLFGDVENEYDPAKPNDYEAVMQERERKKQEAELEAEKQERLLHEQKERTRSEKRPVGPLEESEATPQSRRKITPDPAPPPPATGEGKGMPLAQKMLEKFGWRAGEGLGKERQGMATPLVAQKTDTRSAVIVKAEGIAEASETAQAAQIPPIRGKATRVVLLRNLVGPGEVDDDLEDEVAVELQKYGRVQRVLIFEVTESNFPPEEAIRIFVEFKTSDEARKAATALNGRFFGGRVVRAGYYSVEKFNACDLAPVAREAP